MLIIKGELHSRAICILWRWCTAVGISRGRSDARYRSCDAATSGLHFIKNGKVSLSISCMFCPLTWACTLTSRYSMRSLSSSELAWTACLGCSLFKIFKPNTFQPKLLMHWKYSCGVEFIWRSPQDLLKSVLLGAYRANLLDVAF